MENAPIDGLDALERHLKVLVEKSETPFDAKLFDDVELQLTRKWIAFLLSAGKNDTGWSISLYGLLKALRFLRMRHGHPSREMIASLSPEGHCSPTPIQPHPHHLRDGPS